MLLLATMLHAPGKPVIVGQGMRGDWAYIIRIGRAYNPD